MKKYLFSIIFLLVSYVGISQKGLSYQAVILDPNAIEVPGQDISGQPFVNGDVWMKFSIYNGSTLQFEEVHKTRTDAYGLVNLMIGSVSTASFNSLVWDSSQKTLQVHVSFNQGGSYLKVSEQKLSYSPYTLFAETAGKLGGVLGIAGGGTGATTVADARLNLGLDQVNNTSDAAKPVSTATQAALELKANLADITAALVAKADTEDIKAYVDSKIVSSNFTSSNQSSSTTTISTAALALKANTADVTLALSAKADTAYVLTKVAAATIVDADANTKGKIQLAGDLAGTAAAPTIPGLVLKANAADLVTLTTVVNANTVSITTNGTAITTEATTARAAELVLTNNVAANTASITANTNAILLKAPIASPVFTGTVAIGTANPSSAAVLDITSTSKGLLLPRLTFSQKSAITSPEAGLILWCSDCGTNGELQVYNGTNFVNMVGANAQFALPKVSATSAATAITSSALTSGGSIDSDGGAFVTTRGVVWNTSINPTTSLSTKTSDGTGIGTFSSSLTGLTSGVTYYVRAYATNSVGTKYGPEITVNSAQAVATLASTTAASTIGSTSATSGGNITYNGGATVTVSGLVWSTTSTPTIALSTKTTDGTANGIYSSSITGLTVGTLYYVRSYATNNVGTSYGAQTSFTTLNTATISATTAASSISSSSATSGGTITSDGGSAVTASGIVYGTSAGSSTYSVTSGSGTGIFASNLTGLLPATTYYVRSFATNSVGTVYGSEISFTSLAIAPTLTTTAASSITKYAASAGGTITSNGGSTITASGICWSTTATPTTSNSKTTDGTASGTYTSSITGLTAGTTYYVRAYATNAIGTSYGAAQSFTTSSPSTTLNIVGDAYGGGIIAYIYQSGDPGYSSINTPVLISATSDQTSGGRVNWSNSSNLSTEVNLSGASYEILGAGSANTDAIISLYTNTGTYAAKTARDYRGGGFYDWYLPSRDELNKLYINRVVIGSFNTNNSHPVSVYWASTEANSSVANGQNFGTGSYLPDSKAWTFQVRAVRTTTLIPVAINNPVLAATTAASGITSSLAILGGNVTDEGATQVSARGLVYGTTTGSSTFSVTVGSGGGTFTSILTGLAQGTTYYVRSFATNVQGTGYGAETSFTTQTTATISVTATPTSVTTTSATGGGTISSTGGATITTSGLVWDASLNPTIALSTKTNDGTITGTFTSSITGLTQGTSYHVRAYATNYLGTTYGPDITFTTITTPTVSATATVTSITGTTATSGGTISADGGASVIERGLVWGTSTGASTYSVTTGTGTGTFTSSLTGLSVATTYYVRAFATNSVGTVYGPEESFATPTTATLTSTISSTITSYTAILGGVLSSTGGATTEIGIRYSTDVNFGTYSTTSINANATAGTYTTTISGLTALTTYYAKAYATNTAGTTEGISINFNTPAPPIAVGDSYRGGIVYYLLKSGDNGYDANVQHGLIAAETNPRVNATGTWTKIAINGNAILGAQNTGTLVGKSNTAAIIANQGTASTYLFRYVNETQIGIYNDWYVPSQKELELFRSFIYTKQVIIGGVLTNLYTNDASTGDSYYWRNKLSSNNKYAWGHYLTSTQNSNNSYACYYIEGGSLDSHGYERTQGSDFTYVAIRSF
ncbi:beta strand repeat-containing protein [Aquirufa sp. A-Brett2-15D]